jgi:hypothetical protein
MGGKSSPPPPDYSGMEALGREQLAFSKQQYAEMMPLARQVYGQQMDAQRQQMNQAQNYFDYQQQTFRPVEQGLVRDAERFSTEGYREQMAGQAAAAAGRAFGVQQDMGQRALASRGVSPNSGAALALQSQGNLGLAAQRANAMTGARTQAEQLGFARRMDVTGLGRGLAGASTAAYQGATGAGSAGINTAMAPGNQYMQGMQQAGGTMGGILNSQTSAYNAGMAQQGLDVGGLLAGGAKAYTAFMAPSDRRLKQNIELVGRDERTMLPLYEFEYINGSGRRFLGVMAQDVLETHPEMVFTMPDGFMAVNYAGLGIEMMEVDHAS